MHPMSDFFGIDNVASAPEVPAPLWMTLGVHVLRMWEFDQKQQRFTMKTKMDWMWRDCRLMHDHAEIITLGDEHILFSKFWRPAVELREHEHKSLTDHKTETLRIMNSGIVILTQLRTDSLHCKFDFRSMPFDTQHCSITLSLPNFQSHHLELLWDQDEATALMLDPLSSAEWTIAPRNEWRISNTTFTAYYPMSTEIAINALVIDFALHRKSTFLCISYVMPAVIYWLCSYAGLWVDRASVPGRVALGLIPLLTLNNKWSSLKAMMPPINDGTRLENFMIFTFMITGLQLLEFCAVNWASTHARWNDEKQKKRPVSREESIVVVPIDVGQGKNAVVPIDVDLESVPRRSSLKHVVEERIDRVDSVLAKWMCGNLDFHSRWVFMIMYILGALYFMCWW